MSGSGGGDAFVPVSRKHYDALTRAVSLHFEVEQSLRNLDPPRTMLRCHEDGQLWPCGTARAMDDAISNLEKLYPAKDYDQVQQDQSNRIMVANWKASAADDANSQTNPRP